MAQIKNPLIIDIEASGFGATSYPIEVGIALEDDQKYCTLIKPASSWTHWDEGAETVHHISRDTLNSHGKALLSVCKQLNLLLAGKTIYTDGWVVDKPWLLTLFSEAKIAMNFQISALEMILSEAQMECWHETKDQILKEENGTRHRASYDAWIIKETYNRTLKATKPH